MNQDNPSTSDDVEILSPEEASQQRATALFDLLEGTVLSPNEAKQLTVVEQLIALAHTQLHQARNEAEAIREQARREGYAAGLLEANEALVQARAEYDALMRRSEGDMVSLALELTRTIVGRSLELDPEIMVQLVARTLELARGRRNIEVHVHPQDIPPLGAHVDTLKEVASSQAVFILEDPNVPPGGCRIETEAGIIEADLETQLDVLAQHLGVERWVYRTRNHDG
ncbi:MAG: FliH/SctL family protein [Myxococcota bacterium]